MNIYTVENKNTKLERLTHEKNLGELVYYESYLKGLKDYLNAYFSELRVMEYFKIMNEVIFIEKIVEELRKNIYICKG